MAWDLFDVAPLPFHKILERDGERWIDGEKREYTTSEKRSGDLTERGRKRACRDNKHGVETSERTGLIFDSTPATTGSDKSDEFVAPWRKSDYGDINFANSVSSNCTGFPPNCPFSGDLPSNICDATSASEVPIAVPEERWITPRETGRG